MNKLFSIALRPGLLAAGLLSCLLAPVAAGAMPMPPVKAPSSNITQVRDAEMTPSPNQWILRRNQRNLGGGHYWDKKSQWNNNRNGHWNNDRRHWRRDNSWRYRNHYRGNSGFYLGLGVIPSYNYYDAPSYAAPRRHYRAGSSAHVRWCYDRYRSYRAWDNTYQPYNGSRRQCYSPYS